MMDPLMVDSPDVPNSSGFPWVRPGNPPSPDRSDRPGTAVGERASMLRYQTARGSICTSRTPLRRTPAGETSIHHRGNAAGQEDGRQKVRLRAVGRHGAWSGFHLRAAAL